MFRDITQLIIHLNVNISYIIINIQVYSKMAHYIYIT
jgi:hypothetical protein